MAARKTLAPSPPLPEMAAFAVWLALVAAALALTAALVARGSPVRFGAATMVLLGGAIAGQSLFAGNLSALLAPVTVAVLLAFHRERWLLGCAILAVSLLIKPLLAPLILIPVLRRRRLALARTMLPAGALLLLAMALVPGGRTFPRVLLDSLAGSNLQGPDADENLAVRGWAEAHRVPPALGVLAAATIVAGIVVMVAVRFRVGPPAWLGAVLLLGTFLAGGIAEANYLFAAAAAVLLHLALRPGGWAAYLPGFALLTLPSPATQTALVAGELALLAALLFEPARLMRCRVAPAALPWRSPPTKEHSDGTADPDDPAAARAAQWVGRGPLR